jgi:hypothetical protein
VLRRIVDFENYRYLRIKTAKTQRREVWFCFEHQSISSVGNWLRDEKERLNAAVSISPCMTQLGPTLVDVLHLKTHRNATRGRSPRSIENVSGNGAHSDRFVQTNVGTLVLDLWSLNFNMVAFKYLIKLAFCKDQRPKTKDQRPKTKDQRPRQSISSTGSPLSSLVHQQLFATHQLVGYSFLILVARASLREIFQWRRL